MPTLKIYPDSIELIMKCDVCNMMLNFSTSWIKIYGKQILSISTKPCTYCKETKK